MIAGRRLFFSGLFPDAITSREYHSTIFNSFMHFFFPGAFTSLLCLFEVLADHSDGFGLASLPAGWLSVKWLAFS